MIGLIDVSIEYSYGVEQVTLAFYSSSGTNNGKIKGLWYPIVGIKTTSGPFNEFTDYLNFVLTLTTIGGFAKKGWLAKSLFFEGQHTDNSKTMGFSSGKHYESLLEIGKNLKDLYEKREFYTLNYLDAHTLNKIITSKKIYAGNSHAQRENFEEFIQDIFTQA